MHVNAACHLGHQMYMYIGEMHSYPPPPTSMMVYGYTLIVKVFFKPKLHWSGTVLLPLKLTRHPLLWHTHHQVPENLVGWLLSWPNYQPITPNMDVNSLRVDRQVNCGVERVLVVSGI